MTQYSTIQCIFNKKQKNKEKFQELKGESVAEEKEAQVNHVHQVKA